MGWKLDSDRPIHVQLLELLKTGIVSGEYEPGSKIPSVRELAAEAGVNPNTMQRAFGELERLELIKTERTTGRFVTDDEKLIGLIRDDMAKGVLNDFVRDMKRLGFSNESILAFVKAGLEEE